MQVVPRAELPHGRHHALHGGFPFRRRRAFYAEPGGLEAHHRPVAQLHDTFVDEALVENLVGEPGITHWFKSVDCRTRYTDHRGRLNKSARGRFSRSRGSLWA